VWDLRIQDVPSTASRRHRRFPGPRRARAIGASRHPGTSRCRRSAAVVPRTTIADRSPTRVFTRPLRRGTFTRASMNLRAAAPLLPRRIWVQPLPGREAVRSRLPWTVRRCRSRRPPASSHHTRKGISRSTGSFFPSPTFEGWLPAEAGGDVGSTSRPSSIDESAATHLREETVPRASSMGFVLSHTRHLPVRTGLTADPRAAPSSASQTRRPNQHPTKASVRGMT
jgi:hypothetical protein